MSWRGCLQMWHRHARSRMLCSAGRTYAITRSIYRRPQASPTTGASPTSPTAGSERRYPPRRQQEEAQLNRCRATVSSQQSRRKNARARQAFLSPDPYARSLAHVVVVVDDFHTSQLHGLSLPDGRRFSCSFFFSGSLIITAAVLNASAAWLAQSCRGTLLRAMWPPAGSDLASSTSYR